jgi:predicted secreted Zn-dependent protease
MTSTDVILGLTVETPTWAERDQASPSEQAAWDEGLNNLKDHEQEHVKDFRTAASDLDKSLPGTKGTGDGTDGAKSDAFGAANKKLDTAVSDEHKKTADLDTRTDHGQKPDPQKENH